MGGDRPGQREQPGPGGDAGGRSEAPDRGSWPGQCHSGRGPTDFAPGLNANH